MNDGELVNEEVQRLGGAETRSLLDAAKVATLERLAKHAGGETDADGRVTFVSSRHASPPRARRSSKLSLWPAGAASRG